MQSTRFRKYGDQWLTPSGYSASPRETELLNEIEMLNWELEIIKSKLNQIIEAIKV